MKGAYMIQSHSVVGEPFCNVHRHPKSTILRIKNFNAVLPRQNGPSCCPKKVCCHPKCEFKQNPRTRSQEPDNFLTATAHNIFCKPLRLLHQLINQLQLVTIGQAWKNIFFQQTTNIKQLIQKKQKIFCSNHKTSFFT